jgi:hypothetical protein
LSTKHIVESSHHTLKGSFPKGALGSPGMAFTARTSKPQPRRQTRESRQAHRRAAVIPRAQSEGNDSGYNVEAAELARKLGCVANSSSFSPCSFTLFSANPRFPSVGCRTPTKPGSLASHPSLVRSYQALPSNLQRKASPLFVCRALCRPHRNAVRPHVNNQPLQFAAKSACNQLIHFRIAEVSLLASASSCSLVCQHCSKLAL